MGSCNKSCNIPTFPQISTIVYNQVLEPIYGRLCTGSSPVRAAISQVGVLLNNNPYSRQNLLTYPFYFWVNVIC
jgi:hypothetical protein